MSWTKKHDEFCLEQKLRPSSRLLLRWLLRRAKLNEICEIEIDLKKFNAWVARVRGREFDRKTIREAIEQLDEQTKGMICIYRSYTPWVKKLIVRPLSFVVEKKPPTMGNTPKQTTGNPMFDTEQKKKSSDLLLQNISRLDTFLKSLGMNCNQETLHRMWRYAGKKMSEVENAVEYMLKCHKEKIEQSESLNEDSKGIFKPIGWLHDCLKYGRHINVDENVRIPYFDSILALSDAVKRLSVQASSSCYRNQLRYQT